MTSTFAEVPVSNKQEELTKMCNDYSEFLQFREINSDQVNAITDTVELMLTQLDEFTSLVDTVRMNIETTQTLIPPLLAHSKQLERTFALLDALEEFMFLLDGNVSKLESRVSSAEQSSSAVGQGVSKAKQMLSSFGRSFSSQQVNATESADVKEGVPPVEIMDTVGFFAKLKVNITQNMT